MIQLHPNRAFALNSIWTTSHMVKTHQQEPSWEWQACTHTHTLIRAQLVPKKVSPTPGLSKDRCHVFFMFSTPKTCNFGVSLQHTPFWDSYHVSLLAKNAKRQNVKRSWDSESSAHQPKSANFACHMVTKSSISRCTSVKSKASSRKSYPHNRYILIPDAGWGVDVGIHCRLSFCSREMNSKLWRQQQCDQITHPNGPQRLLICRLHQYLGHILLDALA